MKEKIVGYGIMSLIGVVGGIVLTLKLEKKYIINPLNAYIEALDKKLEEENDSNETAERSE